MVSWFVCLPAMTMGWVQFPLRLFFFSVQYDFEVDQGQDFGIIFLLASVSEVDQGQDFGVIFFWPVWLWRPRPALRTRFQGLISAKWIKIKCLSDNIHIYFTYTLKLLSPWVIEWWNWRWYSPAIKFWMPTTSLNHCKGLLIFDWQIMERFITGPVNRSWRQIIH